jgi:hypothetical protein
MSTEQRYTPMQKGKGRAPSPPTNGYQPYTSRPMPTDNQRRDTPAKSSNGTNGTEESHKSTHVAINPLAKLPLSAIDKAFAERVEANNLKPKLKDMNGPCPVWSNTRKGLQSALDYMRNPVKTAGASVDINPGGMARGVILEGQIPSDLAYWGQGTEGGTLILPM